MNIHRQLYYTEIHNQYMSQVKYFIAYNTYCVQVIDKAQVVPRFVASFPSGCQKYYQ